jgi:hypothetical protein
MRKLYDATDSELRSVICDEEKAFESAETVAWLKEKGIGIKYVSDQNHTALAVVDRLIRTLRDMNTPTRASEETSEARQFRDFTDKRMQEILKLYNSTTHGTTKMKPAKMQNDKAAEVKYIIRKLYEANARKKIADYDLKVGLWVRYILPRDANKKNRYKVSPEKYQIKGKDGNAYLIAAEDGSTKSVARWRLLPIKDAAEVKEGKAFTTKKGKPKNNHVVIRLKDYRPKKGKEPARYLTEWADKTGDNWETEANLRFHQVDKTVKTKWEKDFWKSAKGQEIRNLSASK